MGFEENAATVSSPTDLVVKLERCVREPGRWLLLGPIAVLISVPVLQTQLGLLCRWRTGGGPAETKAICPLEHFPSCYSDP